MLAVLGRPNEALDYIHRAIRLNPNDFAVGRWNMFGGQIELELGHDDSAIEWLLRAVTLSPRIVRAHALLAAAYALKGKNTDAMRQVAEVQRLAHWAADQAIFNDGSLGPSETHTPRYVQGWRLALAVASAAASPESTSGQSSRPAR